MLHPMYTPQYPEDAHAPSLEEIASLKGHAVLEFGTNWCPICQGAQRAIRDVLEPLPDLTHIKVEDGPGRRLGRSFKVKLWPTLIFLKDGQEVARTVRPTSPDEIRDALAELTGAS
jgi:thioredoxin 1